MFAAKFFLETFPLTETLFDVTVNSAANLGLPDSVRLVSDDYSKFSATNSRKQLVKSVLALIFERCQKFVQRTNQETVSSQQQPLRFDPEEVILCLLSLIFQNVEPCVYEDCGSALVVDLSDLKRIVKQLFHCFDNLFGLKPGPQFGTQTHHSAREGVMHVAKYLVGESTLNNIQDCLPSQILRSKFEIFLKIVQNAQKYTLYDKESFASKTSAEYSKNCS